MASGRDQSQEQGQWSRRLPEPPWLPRLPCAGEAQRYHRVLFNEDDLTGEKTMPDLTLWGLFVAASLVLLLTPGPAVLYIVARSVQQGRTAGLASVIGIHLGTTVHITAAAVGLSALLVSSALAFAVVRYAGAAYLILLGIRALLDRGGTDPAGAAAARPPARAGRTFRQAFGVGIANPKVALFFLAFLPQFVSPAAGSATLQVLVLGLVFLAVATVLDLGWALLAGWLAGCLRRHPALLRRQRFATGPVYLGLGAYAAGAGGKSR